MLELFKIAGKIDLEGADKADKTLDGIDKKAGGLGSKIGGAAKKVGKAGLVIGGAMGAAGTAAFAMTEKVTGAFDDISKGSQRLGVSTDAYQELDFWASQNGMSHEQMEKVVGRFNQRLGQAVNGNEKYASALSEVGVNLDDVRDGTLNTEDAYGQTIQKLSEMESEQDKVNLATEIFGQRTARDLLPALQDGALSMEDAKKKAEELGIVIGEDSLDSAVKFQDTWDQLKRTMTTAGQTILADLMPMFQTLMDWIMEHMPQIQSIIQTAFNIIGAVFTTATSWIQSLISWLSEWYSSNEETMTGIWTKIQEVFNQIVAFLQSAWETIRAFWEENGAMILANARNTFNNIRSVVETVFGIVRDIIQAVMDYVVPFLKEQLDKIMAFWNQNGDQIMDAVNNAFKFIQGVIEFVMPIIKGIIKGAWKIITSVFETAVDVIMGIVKYFSSLLTGDFEGMNDAIQDIWGALWDGIKGVVSGAWSMLSGAFSGLWSSISGWFSGLKDDALQWGKNMIQGFIDGIAAMGSKVASAASNVIDKAAGFIKFWSPAKKGEGRYIRHWGRNMVDGFLDGVRDEEDSAGKAMENVVKRMNPGSVDFDATVGGRGAMQAVGATESTAATLSTGNIEGLLQQLIQAVNANRDVYIDGEKVTGAVNTNNAVNEMGRVFD